MGCRHQVLRFINRWVPQKSYSQSHFDRSVSYSGGNLRQASRRHYLTFKRLSSIHTTMIETHEVSESLYLKKPQRRDKVENNVIIVFDVTQNSHVWFNLLRSARLRVCRRSTGSGITYCTMELAVSYLVRL